MKSIALRISIVPIITTVFLAIAIPLGSAIWLISALGIINIVDAILVAGLIIHRTKHRGLPWVFGYGVLQFMVRALTTVNLIGLILFTIRINIDLELTIYVYLMNITTAMWIKREAIVLNQVSDKQME